MRTWVVSVGVAALGLRSASPLCAEGAPQPLELHWQAPEGCPEASAFSAAVNRLVGNAEPVSKKVRADIRIDKDNSGNYTLVLTTECNAILGERVLHGHSCHAVADAAVVTLALILNPDIEIPPDGSLDLPVKSNPEKSSEEAKPPAAPMPMVPMPLLPNRSQVATSLPMRWFATSALGLEIGVLPRPAPEVSLGFGAAFGKYSAKLGAGYCPAQTIKLTEPAGGRLWNLTLTMAACWATSDLAPRIGTCLEGAFTRVHGYGLGVPHLRSGTTSWFAPGLGVFIDLPLNRRAMLQFAGTGLVPIARPDTHLDFVGLVQRPAQLTASLQAGVMAFFD